jgi:hypothetical protein
MTMTTIIILNLALSLVAVLGVAGLTLLAHRLPSKAPLEDERWGRGHAHVPHDPLPLAQLARHEDELARAA